MPRLLGNLDRNPFSPTYGCFHREYWLEKTSDFPDAVRQFAVHAFALVYKHDFPGSPYKGHASIRDWTIAALDFWAQIQHGDGSFDEFYPYERGWVGPTGFTTYASSQAFMLLRDEMPAETTQRVESAIRKAATFIAAGESEEDHLANHHAMACLAVWEASRMLNDSVLEQGFDRLWQGFLAYRGDDDGWFREYDGADPGYLSAVVSFLGKISKTRRDPELLAIAEKAAEFCSYFAYPDGFYAGSMGSRNTTHFYPHGFEVLGPKSVVAMAVAENMLQALSEGKLVPPEIMSDRYLVYRVPEFLQSYLDYTPRSETIEPLPYQRAPFRKYFSGARTYAAVNGDRYVIANLAKGGVLKVFNRLSGRLLLNDCGLIGRLADGRIVTTQWIDDAHECEADGDRWKVSGSFNAVPSHKLFTPLKQVLFRGALMTAGRIPYLAHLLKGYIRKALIMGHRPVAARFSRRYRGDGSEATIVDEVQLDGNLRFEKLVIGGEFSVRYVPQSRYFQAHELEATGRVLSREELDTLNTHKSLTITRTVKS
ncbi:hypothetical protein M1N23_00025 [Dehalococcoidia bacterium]|nr:hypothetical protein [Dehalococcoidia bacterium]